MSDTRSRRARHRPRHASTLRHGLIIPAVASVVLAVLGFYGMQGVATVAFATANANTADISSLLGDEPEYISAPVATDDNGEPVDVNAGEDLNILVIGSDVRSDENASIGGYFDGARGDTTIIVHISADRTRMELVSIPRDTRVAVSDCESFDGQFQRGWTGKFNIAFSNGYGFNNDPAEAAACVMRTLNDLTGVDFDGQFVVADFTGFRDMVDALGGVPMCVPFDVYSKKAKLDLDAGAQVLNGTDALAWARARTGTNLGDGTDLMRIGRQQELIESMLRKALGMNAFTDMSVMTQFVKAATNSFTMSEEFADVTYDFGIAYSLRNIDLNNVTMVTAPWAYAGDASGDVVLTWEADAVWEALRNDTPLADLESDDESEGTSTEAPTAVDTSENEATMFLPIPPEASFIPDTERETVEEILAAC